MHKLLKGFAMVAVLVGSGSVAQAAELMPTFDTTAGWAPDRYPSPTFSAGNTYQGHTDVLDIGIDSSSNLANRPSAYQYTFYNTQGYGHDISGGAGSTLSAQLYVEPNWVDPANGNIRTDIWGVMSNGGGVSDYAIIGITNYGGAERWRYWDSDLLGGAGNWVDLADPVTSGWNTLGILFTGSAYDYYINNTLVAQDLTVDGSTEFSSVLMQAYNFADPSLGATVPTAYDVHYSNVAATNVPEPLTITLFAAGLLGMASLRRRKNATA